MGRAMVPVTSDTDIGGELMYELLLLPRWIRVEALESRRALSRCFFNSRCSGVRMPLEGLAGSVFGTL